MSKVPKHQPPKRAAIYVRVSTAKQAEEGLSLPEQERSCREAVEQRGWELDPKHEYVERGVSGRRDTRPALDRLLAAADAGAIDAVVIVRLNRLGRSVKNLSENFDRLDRAGVELVSLKESIDTTTSAGKLLRNILAAIAEFENDARGEAVADVARARAELGEFPGGRFPPYGYRREAKALVVVPEQADVVRRIFRRSEDGASQHQITRELNADGIKTARGKRWTQGSIARLLRSQVYYGAVTYKGEVVCERGKHEPIVTQEQFERVQRGLAERDNAPGARRGRAPKGTHLFTDGLLRCSCGYALVPRSERDRYVCRGQIDNGADFCDQPPIPRDRLDTAVYWYFERVGLDVAATREAFEETARLRLREAEVTRREAERAEQEAEVAYSRIRGDYKRGALTSEEWREFREELEGERAAAAAEADRLRAREREIADRSVLGDAEEEVLRRLAEIREAVAGEVRDASSVEAARAALLRLFSRFEVYSHEGKAIEDGPHKQAKPDEVLFLLAGSAGMLRVVPVVRPQAVERLHGLLPVLRKTHLDTHEQVRHTG